MLLKYKHRTGSTEFKVKPHGSTGTDDFTGDRHNMSGQAIQLNEHMTEKRTKRVIHRCEVQNQNNSKLTCTNMVLLKKDMHDLDDSTCITSLLCPV